MHIRDMMPSNFYIPEDERRSRRRTSSSSSSSSRLTRLPSIDVSWYPEDLILLSYVELQRLHVLLMNKMNFVQDYVDDLKAQVEHDEKIKKEENNNKNAS
jgi:hypothetical protein